MDKNIHLNKYILYNIYNYNKYPQFFYYYNFILLVF